MTVDEEIYNAIIENRNQAVFSRLYKDSFPKIRSYILNNNGDDDDASDIFQETVIVLMRTVLKNKIEKGRKLQPFLYVVAKNLWIDKQRRERNKVPYDSATEHYMEAEESIAEEIEMRERSANVDTILKLLGDTCYKILTEIIQDNKDYTEIAAMLGLGSGGVVKTYKHRCKQKLITLLKSDSGYRKILIDNETRFKKYL